MAKSVLVTGATGNLGGAVLDILHRQGVPCRGAVSDVEQAKQRLGREVPLVKLDFYDPSTFASALEGCHSLFLMRPPAISRVKTTLNVLLDVATEKNLKHVVFVSVAGAENNSMVPHHDVEQHLILGDLPYTILRPGFFAQNIGGAYRKDIREDQRIFLPAGDAQVAFIDARDIAEVACLALLHPAKHHDQAYTLTGGELVTFYDVAAILSEVLGQSIRYQPTGALRYSWHLWRNHKLPWMQVVVQTFLHVRLRYGDAATIDPTLSTLLLREPRTIRDYIEDYKELWLPAGA